MRFWIWSIDRCCGLAMFFSLAACVAVLCHGFLWCVDAGGWWCVIWWCVMGFDAGGVLKKYVTVDVMSGVMCDA
jgi:hypothetical protein